MPDIAEPEITWRLDLYQPNGSKLTDFSISSPQEHAVRTALLALCEAHDLQLTFHHKMQLRAGTLTGAIDGQAVSWFRIVNVFPMPAPLPR
jgi:hypothetical protein